MKVNTADFVKSAFEERHWPRGSRPEIAFLGRSNVGKSSLINSLLGRKKLARTSNTPGRTQSINFFLINEAFCFVDLPGYGYAKVPKKIKAGWGKMAEDYLANRRQLVLSIQIVDVRHRPSILDLELYDWLSYHHKKSLVVATKADKLSNNKLRNSLKIVAECMPGSTILPYSSVTGKGKEEVWHEIGNVLNSRNG
ncbi:MAG: ribosome biogenesis GTP-binding protein YihA/YsxC [Acidobacteriota bacterium]|nr:ribosome biogenesis GTP-binding protein YihA/YsxC [Acidobacteriota bacterium]MDH3529713.1 ribosome biogenesis GTP-binding protein YihA/YsxC [Acidobacteriota bacterium]